MINLGGDSGRDKGEVMRTTVDLDEERRNSVRKRAIERERERERERLWNHMLNRRERIGKQC